MGIAPLLLIALLAGQDASMPADIAAVADTMDSKQLVAVLQLRRENLPHFVRGEIYPIALLEGDSLADVVTFGVHPLTGADEFTSDRETPLTAIRDFTIYHHGNVIGAFSVNDIETAVYSCSPVRVGTGTLSLPDEYIRFGRFDPRVTSLAVSGRGFEYEYTLNYYLALSQPVEQPEFKWDSLFNPAATERLREAIIRIASDSLTHYEAALNQADTHWGEPQWSWAEGFRTFDLDQDGWAEAMGVVEALVVPPGNDSLESGSENEPFHASILMWVEDRGPDTVPQVLLTLKQAAPTSKVDLGYHLAEVVDIDGDGVAELFYQIEGLEYHAFAIYAFRNDTLHEWFSGASYGC
jgi:hypothetical protein